MGFIAKAFGMGAQKAPKTPAVNKADPVAEQAKIDGDATAASNAAIAEAKRQRQLSALATGAGSTTGDTAATSSAMAYGKTTLGG